MLEWCMCKHPRRVVAAVITCSPVHALCSRFALVCSIVDEPTCVADAKGVAAYTARAAIRSAVGSTAGRADEGDISLSYPKVDGVCRRAMCHVVSLL